MLEARVLALCVLTDDDKVDVAVAGGEARHSLAERDGGVDVELLAHGDVPRRVPTALDGGVEDTWDAPAVSAGTNEGWKEGRTLESDLVPPERVHALLEERGVRRRVARDVEALELDGNVDVLCRRSRRA